MILRVRRNFFEITTFPNSVLLGSEEMPLGGGTPRAMQRAMPTSVHEDPGGADMGTH